MEANTLKTIGLVLPLVGAATGGGYAYWRNKKEQQNIKNNLRSSAHTVLRPDTFGKQLPNAQRRFAELSEIAPRTMGRPHFALPLLVAATQAGNASPEYINTLEHASNIERGLHVRGEFETAGKRQIDAHYTRGLQMGSSLAGLVGLAADSPAVPSGKPAAASSAAEGVLAPSGTPLNQKAPPGGFSSAKTNDDLADLALGYLGRQGVNNPTNEQIVELMNNPNLPAMARAKGMPMKTASAKPSDEALGDILAITYLMGKTASGMHKLSFDYKDILTSALVTSAVAGVGAAATWGAEKGYDAWKAHKDRTHFDASFGTAMKRLEQGVAGDPYFEQVSAKLKQDPVRYRQMAREAFDLLAEASPTVAKHPIVAKSFMARVIQSDGEMPREDLNTYSKLQELTRPQMAGSQKFLNSWRAFGGEAGLGAAARAVVEEPGRQRAEAQQLTMQNSTFQHNLARDAANLNAQRDAQQRQHDMALGLERVKGQHKTEDIHLQHQLSRSRDQESHGRARDLEYLRDRLRRT